MNDNLHTSELFEKAYGNRTWEFYKGLLSHCVKYGKPSQWLDLGAGLGLFTECANKFGIKCIALEGSLDGVKSAKKKIS